MALQRITYFDVAKGIGILWVVFFHTMLFLNGHDTNITFKLYEKGINFIFPFSMPLFFIISGYLAQKSLGEQWPIFINKRVLPLIYLFSLWSVIRWLYFATFQENIIDLAEGKNALQLLSMWIAPTSTLWFIWSLAIFFIIAKTVARTPAFLSLSISLCISILTYADILTFNHFAHRTLALYLPFVLIGATLKQKYVEIFDTRYATIGGLSFIIYLILYISRIFLTDGILFGGIQFLLATCGIVWVLSLSKFIEEWSIARKVMTYFGENTLPIYVVHTLFISALSAGLIGLKGAVNMPYIELIALPFIGGTSLLGALLIKYLSHKLHATWLYRKPDFMGIK